ncbi:MAG: tRNA (N6-threonylcarbamoyladenosine(37)-N6)-methyltransferase TrmO [Planctomycetes bacterium]|nr:tRNA (N6-threonylcarbamoyladenosine(37)-N6)-methyltransferase TrmO [Planctomycetota bacterium]
MKPEPITFEPIGVIRSPFQEVAGTPIQGVFAPEAEGTVEVFEQFADGLRDIEGFSHLYLLYSFDRTQHVSLTVVPFLDDREHGVFATRAPCRPNPIGLSVVRLLARDGCRLRVGELDILDGTPLLDLKPYVPNFDSRPDARAGWVAAVAGQQRPPVADDRFAGE